MVGAYLEGDPQQSISPERNSPRGIAGLAYEALTSEMEKGNRGVKLLSRERALQGVEVGRLDPQGGKQKSFLLQLNTPIFVSLGLMCL